MHYIRSYKKGDTALIEKLREIIKNAENIVFFGGAGVSTESGIPDFRGSGGLYTKGDVFGTSPETILSNKYFRAHPDLFYEYYKTKMLYPYAEPNAAHRALAYLEEIGKLSAIITQNVDGLHQLAGSENVIELHGSSARNYCTVCGKHHSLSHIIESEGVPRCTKCGGLVRPDVVLYGEGLRARALGDAEEAIYYADVLIVGGTSLTVEPAASIVRYFEGEHFIIINSSPTPYDDYAELIIREPIGEVLSETVGW